MPGSADTAVEALHLLALWMTPAQRETPIAFLGDVLSRGVNSRSRGRLIWSTLTISRHLAEQDPSNKGWQQDLAVAQDRFGGVFEAQGKLTEAMAAFEEALAISRRLAEQDPSNAGWLSDLAAAHNRVGGVLEGQGKLTEAQAAFEEDLAISRRLAEQDPSNAGWQSALAAAQNRVGGVLEAQGKLTEAMAAFEEALAISRRLAEQDPSNAGWQRIWRWRTTAWAGCWRRRAS